MCLGLKVVRLLGRRATAVRVLQVPLIFAASRLLHLVLANPKILYHRLVPQMANMAHLLVFPKVGGHRHLHVQKVVADLLLPEVVAHHLRELDEEVLRHIDLSIIRRNRRESIDINTSINLCLFFVVLFF